MTITADHIRTTVDAYLDVHPGEKYLLAKALELLEQQADLASRSEWRGHATAGAIVVRPDGRLLQIHHRALDKWLFPGGHLEGQDTTLMAAALRELVEETGVDPALVTPAGELPAHIDVHAIPANPAKSEPDHWHIDFRFVFRTTGDIGRLQTEEVDEAFWRSPGVLTDHELVRHITAALV
ncbi:NUDIX hydrolase [Yinghuangia soli]|uniref:NUDIX domain-containing protein n=1 Tax=Yinghuangia soli TaxID=2908204 RepID=A0AA41TZV7_9ACTN|nr:NUDIX domain-containing protein [Yinghuangia soli]MCF2527911.1 NUDIX domain-containing protein [Yinghuangia soli]